MNHLYGDNGYLGYVIEQGRSWAKKMNKVKAKAIVVVKDNEYLADLLVSEEYEKYLAEQGIRVVKKEYLEFDVETAELNTARIVVEYDSNEWSDVRDVENKLIRALSLYGYLGFEEKFWRRQVSDD